jgi:hypothetical protein
LASPEIYPDIIVLKGDKLDITVFYETYIHEISFFFLQRHGSMLNFACTTTKLPLNVSECMYGWVPQVKRPKQRKDRQGKPGT